MCLPVATSWQRAQLHFRSKLERRYSAIGNRFHDSLAVDGHSFGLWDPLPYHPAPLMGPVACGEGGVCTRLTTQRGGVHGAVHQR